MVLDLKVRNLSNWKIIWRLRKLIMKMLFFASREDLLIFNYFVLDCIIQLNLYWNFVN